jgi:hypothetical protein
LHPGRSQFVEINRSVPSEEMRMNNTNAAVYDQFADRRQGMDTNAADKIFEDATKMQCSIRALEKIVSHLRQAGHRHAADRLDIRIMSMLEEKIYKKALSKRVRMS